jgi:hypothetical protein
VAAPLSVLLLQGDAEARLLADADLAIQAALPEREIELVRAWTTRPDWLAQGEATTPVALQRDGLLEEDRDIAGLLARANTFIILPFLATVAVPALRHREGGVFLAHRGLRACWSAEAAARVDRECTPLPPLLPDEAEQAFELLIERLQGRGAIVALTMAFRRVREPLHHRCSGGPPSLRELVRRSNLAVARLSQRTGCFVLDLDRPLAQEGGEALDADCFGGTGAAADLALEELAALVMDALPDEQASPELS